MSDADAIVLVATSDLGKAAGLEAAAKVMLGLADHKRRVVGTNELKATAAILQKHAAELRDAANAALRPYTRSNVQ